MDGVPLLQDIEHPQSVDGQHLDGPVALGVQVGGHVGGHGGDIYILVDKGVSDFLVIGDNGAVQDEGHIGIGVFGGIVLHQPGGPHPGGPGEGHELDDRGVYLGGGLAAVLAGAGRAGLAGAGGGGGGPGGGIFGPAARQQRKGQGGGEEQREGTFHKNLPF